MVWQPRTVLGCRRCSDAEAGFRGSTRLGRTRRRPSAQVFRGALNAAEARAERERGRGVSRRERLGGGAHRRRRPPPRRAYRLSVTAPPTPPLLPAESAAATVIFSLSLRLCSSFLRAFFVNLSVSVVRPALDRDLLPFATVFVAAGT